MEKNNIVQFGLSEVAIAMKTGEATYSTPIPIPGAEIGRASCRERV